MCNTACIESSARTRARGSGEVTDELCWKTVRPQCCENIGHLSFILPCGSAWAPAACTWDLGWYGLDLLLVLGILRATGISTGIFTIMLELSTTSFYLFPSLPPPEGPPGARRTPSAERTPGGRPARVLPGCSLQVAGREGCWHLVGVWVLGGAHTLWALHTGLCGCLLLVVVANTV